MKTTMQILKDKGLDELPTDDVTDIMFAMKDYAKQWIYRAAELAQNVTGDENLHDAIIRINHDINEQ